MNSLKNGFLIMLGTFTRIPVRAPKWTDANRRYALSFLPAAGVLAGALSLLWLFAAEAAGEQLFDERGFSGPEETGDNIDFDHFQTFFPAVQNAGFPYITQSPDPVNRFRRFIPMKYEESREVCICRGHLKRTGRSSSRSTTRS